MRNSCLHLVVLLAAASTSLAVRLSCYPLTPSCHGADVHCQCYGAVSFLTWNVSSDRSSCVIKYNGVSNVPEIPISLSGDCNAITSDASVYTNTLIVFNSTLSINLTERVTVSCSDDRVPMQYTYDLASMCIIIVAIHKYISIQ